MQQQTQPVQLTLPLQTEAHSETQPHNPQQLALQAKAQLYRIMAGNLRKEAEVLQQKTDRLNARIANLDAMVAFFSYTQ